MAQKLRLHVAIVKVPNSFQSIHAAQLTAGYNSSYRRAKFFSGLQQHMRVHTHTHTRKRTHTSNINKTNLKENKC